MLYTFSIIANINNETIDIATMPKSVTFSFNTNFKIQTVKIPAIKYFINVYVGSREVIIIYTKEILIKH